jgi:plastocyanin
MTARLTSLLGVVVLIMSMCLMEDGTALGQDKKTEHKVELVDTEFEPIEKTVKEGDTIRFVQNKPHYVQWHKLRPRVEEYKTDRFKVTKGVPFNVVKIDKGFIDEAGKIEIKSKGKIILFIRCPPHASLENVEEAVAAFKRANNLKTHHVLWCLSSFWM